MAAAVPAVLTPSGADRPLRIAMLGPFGLSPKGTMSARALPAARALADRGHAVRLIVPPWHTPETAGRIRWDGAVEVEEVSLAGLRVPAAGHAAVALRMVRSAAGQRPDIVHAFKPKAYSGLAGEMLRLGRYWGGGPALVQDTDDWEGAGGWNDVEAYSSAQRAVFAFQEKWGLRRADHVTCASRALVGRTLALGVAERDATYLPNALDRAAIDRLEEAIKARERRAAVPPPVIVLYTRFFEFPLSRPLDVLVGVRASHPEARLLVVGEGLFGEHAGLMEEAGRRGLADAVDPVGWVKPEDLPRVLAGADVAIYPFDDTLINRTKSPVKLLELLAAGLPVVAERLGEPSVVIEDGVSGRLVQALDVSGFVAAVCEYLSDAPARAKAGKAARRRIVDHFAWDRIAVDLEAAYVTALARRAAP